MKLEEIITAAVEKQLNELFEEAFAGQEYRGLIRVFQDEIAKEAKAAFDLRRHEIQQRIAKSIAETSFDNFKVEVFVSLKKPE